jgi:preprotein translocase SecE subunit
MEEILPPLRRAQAAQRVEVMEQVQAVEQGGGGRVVRWIRGSRDFLLAVRAEMGKVSWPTQAELVKATRMVVVLSAIVGVLLGLLDLLLTKILVDGVAALAR